MYSRSSLHILVTGFALHTDEQRQVSLERCAALSPREKEVLQGLGQRRRAKEIARELNISEHTVRGYANEARQKLGLPSVRDAALLFLEFERNQAAPQNQGDRFQRVARHRTDEAPSEPGYSEPLSDEKQVQDLSAVANADIPAVAGRIEGPDRLGRLHAWLARLSLARWVGLTILLTLGVIMAFGLAAVTVLGVFEVLQQIGGSHR